MADVSTLESDRAALELRKRRRGSMVRKAERRGMTLEMRTKPNGTGGTDFLFTGYGAVFDTPFEMWDPWGEAYTEVVRPGAFTRSLGQPDLDVPFLIGHNDAGIPLARTKNGTLTLAQDTRGLLVEARMDGSRSDVRNLASAVERGDMDEMSIAFVTMAQEWSPDWETRAMLDLEIHRGDVSAVALGANAATAGSSMVPAEALRVARPAEELGGGLPSASDYSDAPDYDPAPHAAPDAIQCQNPACPVEGGALNSPDAKHCDQCGAPLYDADGKIVSDDLGVPTEVGGDASQALALRQRQLQLLKLSA
jgi:HK97 family phage prohead protease